MIATMIDIIAVNNILITWYKTDNWKMYYDMLK